MEIEEFAAPSGVAVETIGERSLVIDVDQRKAFVPRSILEIPPARRR